MSDNVQKKIEDWEVEHNLILVDTKKIDVHEKVSHGDFLEMTDGSVAAVGINHPDRIKFLKDNGYEVTRENMVDSSLSARSDD